MNTMQRLMLVILMSMVYLPIAVITDVHGFAHTGGANCNNESYSWQFQEEMYLQSSYEYSEWEDASVLVMKPYFDSSFPTELSEENYYLKSEAITSNHYSRTHGVGGSLSASATAGASAGVNILGFQIVEASGGITTTVTVEGGSNWGYSTSYASTSQYQKNGNSNSDMGGVINANQLESKYYADHYEEYKLVTDDNDNICIEESGYTGEHKYDLTQQTVDTWTQDTNTPFTHVHNQANAILNDETEAVINSAISSAKSGNSVDYFDKFVEDGTSTTQSGTYLKDGGIGAVGTDSYNFGYEASKTEHSSWSIKVSMEVTNNNAAGLFGGEVEISLSASGYYQYSSSSSSTNTLALDWGVSGGDGLAPGEGYQGKVFTVGPGIGAYFYSYTG